MKVKGIAACIFTLVIIVYEIAAFIEVGNLPATVTVHEDVTSQTFLYSVLAYSPAGTATCTIASGDTGSNFQLIVENGQQNIYTVTSPTFDYGGTTMYNLVVECTLSGETAQGTLTVNLVENSAPVMSNLPGEVTISAKTVKANTVIFTVSYNDTDNSRPLTYSNLVTSPVGGPFSLADDQLKITANLTAHTVSYYDVTFDVTDGRTTSSAQTIAVTIDDINSLPEFVDGPSVTKVVPEHTAGRVMVYDIEHTDAEGDPVQFEYETVLIANSIWDLIGATGEIYLISGNTLDYEDTSQYILTVKLHDNIGYAVSYFTLTIDVSDVEEAPTYTGVPSAVSKDESPSGTVIGTLDQLCTDPDGTPPDTITYSILYSTYSANFSINPSTAEVSFVQDWDFDTPLPANVNLTIRCSDSAGYYDDAIYQITILDINDNDPVCSPAQTSFILHYNQIVGDTILNLQCSDIDSTVNAELDYTMVGLTTGYTKQFFGSDAYGNVSITTTFTMDYNTTFYVTVRVADRGTPSRSTTVTLTVSYVEEPTIITYTEPVPCFLCTTGAITIIAALGFVVLMITIFCCVLCILKCCYDYERRKIIKHLNKRKKTPWRCCGCLRPGRVRRRPKKSRREVELAENRDREYMRAREALLGAKDAPLIPEAPSQAVYDDPDLLKPKTSKSRSILSRLSSKVKNRTPASSKSKDPPLPPPSVPPPSTYSYKGRESGPLPLNDPRIVTPNSLTITEKEQLATFRSMQQSNGQGEVPRTRGMPPTGTTRRLKNQGASGMVWTFQGRDTDDPWA